MIRTKHNTKKKTPVNLFGVIDGVLGGIVEPNCHSFEHVTTKFNKVLFAKKYN